MRARKDGRTLVVSNGALGTAASVRCPLAGLFDITTLAGLPRSIMTYARSYHGYCSAAHEYMKKQKSLVEKQPCFNPSHCNDASLPSNLKPPSALKRPSQSRQFHQTKRPPAPPLAQGPLDSRHTPIPRPPVVSCTSIPGIVGSAGVEDPACLGFSAPVLRPS
jgi:hypothetical protein